MKKNKVSDYLIIKLIITHLFLILFNFKEMI